ncbi:hypothetical protein OKW30_003104 [Paraburkholderia sp. Clong3]
MARGRAVRRGRHVLRGRRPQRACRRRAPQRVACGRQRPRSNGTDAHAFQQTGDRRDRRLCGGGWARACRDVRPARRRGRCGARRVLPACRHSADRRRHDPAAATDRSVACARSDPDRPRGRCARGAFVWARQPRGAEGRSARGCRATRRGTRRVSAGGAARRSSLRAREQHAGRSRRGIAPRRRGRLRGGLRRGAWRARRVLRPARAVMATRSTRIADKTAPRDR